MTIKEQTILLKKALLRSPVGVAVSAWQKNGEGEYIKFTNWNNYVVLVAYDEQDRAVIWDSYEESLKTLAKDYELEFAQIYMLNREKVVKQSWWEKLINFFKQSCQNQ